MEIMIGIIVVGALFVAGEVGLRYQLRKRGYEKRPAALSEHDEPPSLQSKDGNYRKAPADALLRIDEEEMLNPDREAIMRERREKMSDSAAFAALVEAMSVKGIDDPEVRWLARSLPLDFLLKRNSSSPERKALWENPSQLPWVEDGVANALIARRQAEDAPAIFIWSTNRVNQDFPLAAVRAVTAVRPREQPVIAAVLLRMTCMYTGRPRRIAEEALRGIEEGLRSDLLIEAVDEGMIETGPVSEEMRRTEIGRRKWMNYTFGGMSYARYKASQS